VIRKDPAINEIVGPNLKIFKLAEGFQFTEGPIWVRDGGYLVFSDPNANTQYKFTKDGELSVFRHPSGYSGADIAEYGQPGSNGCVAKMVLATRLRGFSSAPASNYSARNPSVSLMNRISPTTSPLGNQLTWPFRIMFTAS